MCDADQARLWGVSLCGPLIVADPSSRQVWASESDMRRTLQPAGPGFVGQLPAGVPIANAPVEWGGVRWTMVMSPLPVDPTDRRVLLAHEAWHRVQDRIGFPLSASNAAHLDGERGRYLLRLEMRALATALRSRGQARRGAARDALFIRNVRHAEFVDAQEQEAALDRNEGLAAYTGVRLGATENPDLYAARTLDGYDRHEAYARAYAYATGPAYGLVLDDVRATWRRELGTDAPADLLRTLIRPDPYDPRRLDGIAATYGGPAIAAEEATRARDRAALVAEIRRAYAEGPRLVLPLANMQMEFDPEQVTPVEGLGSVYATLNLRDRWGELRAGDGALISADFTRLVLPRPNPDGLSGPGWSVSLVPGAQLSAPDAAGVRQVAMP